jgi:hypothetical protein
MSVAKTALNKQKVLFISKWDLNFWKKLIKFCMWIIALYGAETLTPRKVDQEYLENFEHVVLEEDGEDYLVRSCEKRRSVTKSPGGEKCPTGNKRKEG